MESHLTNLIPHLTKLSLFITRQNNLVDYRDVLQEGWVRVLTMLPNWNPEKGSLQQFTHRMVRASMVDRKIKEESVAKLSRRQRMAPPEGYSHRNPIDSVTETDFPDQVVYPDFEAALDLAHDLKVNFHQ